MCLNICNRLDFFGPVCFITVGGKKKKQLRLAQSIGFWIVCISQFNIKLLKSKKISVHLHYICTLCIIVKCLDRLNLIRVSVVIL